MGGGYSWHGLTRAELGSSLLLEIAVFSCKKTFALHEANLVSSFF